MPEPLPVAATTETVHLKRSLGRWDLVALFVVAVFNLNVVPSIAANGGVTVWLWLVSLVLFFWPQGIAVIELAHRYPGEGGVYLWAKEVFGDFHGFLSGWCYWTNNMMYVPTVMLYFVGVSVFALGPGHQGLADNRAFTVVASLALMALLVILNIVGLGVGKWINNVGGIGTGVAAAVLIGLGLIVYSRFGTTVTAADFRIPANPRFVLNSFGVICFGLVGLELASVMGDEIKDPQKTLPGAVAWGGVLSGVMYIATTLDFADCRQQERHQCAAGYRASRQPHGRTSRRKLDRGSVRANAEYFDRRNRLGLVGGFGAHTVCRRPGFLHAQLAGQDAPSFRDAVRRADRAGRGLHDFGAGERRRFGRARDVSAIAVVGRGAAARSVLVHVRRAAENCRESGIGQGLYSRTTLLLAGASGLVTTTLGIVLAFFPAQQIRSLWSYEKWMFGGTAFFIGLAVFFFYVYGRRKVAQAPATGI